MMLTRGGFLVVLLPIVVVWGQHLKCEQRWIEGHSPVKQPGDGGFRIGVSGPLASQGLYVPNEVYTVRVEGEKTRYSTQKLTEFLLVVESDKQSMMGPSGLVTTGLFHIVDDALTRFSEICPDGVTSLNRKPKGGVSILWTAPSILVSSCITFKATVVERPHVWFMDDGRLSLTLCPSIPDGPHPSPSSSSISRTPATTSPPSFQAPTPHPSSSGSKVRTTTATSSTPTTASLGVVNPQGPSSSSSLSGSGSGNTAADKIDATTCCACDEAKYDVEFEGIWSRETHPKDFPDNAWLLHFSDIIGASHSPSLWVWREGEAASAGMRQVAEWGSTRGLETELKASAPHINTIIKARGLWHPNERGKSSGAFRVDREHHLVSLVSMLGPSPDWIVGISALQLCLPNCTWNPEVKVDLFPYDAGTDSGITYMSPNSPTTPPGPILRLSPTSPNDSRSPFYGLDPRSIQPFAKLTLTRQRIYPKECGGNSSSSSSLASSSSLFLTENSEDDIDRPECGVLDWTPWSECSVRCGKGLRMRKRLYILPDKADMFRCDRQLVEKEMCLGATPTCPPDELEDGEGICGVTPWSDWSPCSATTCGVESGGRRTRTRRYKNHMGRKRCSVELSGWESCTPPITTSCANNNNNDDPPHPTTASASAAFTTTSAGGRRRSHTHNNTTTTTSTASNTALTASRDLVNPCPISPWSEWSPCSVSCGPGIRLRSRVLLLEEEETGGGSVCGHLTLREAETCVGEYGGGSCEVKREEAAVLCLLPPETGPCRDHRQRYYYHPMKTLCLPFTYGGCKGNRNRFDTEGECTQVCGFLAHEPDPTQAQGTTTPPSSTASYSTYKKRTTPTTTVPTTTARVRGSLDYSYFSTTPTPTRPTYRSFHQVPTSTTPTPTDNHHHHHQEASGEEESFNLNLGAPPTSTERVLPHLAPQPLRAITNQHFPHYTTPTPTTHTITKPTPIGVELGVVVNEREGEPVGGGGGGGEEEESTNNHHHGEGAGGRVDCVVSGWSEWSVCSVPCGTPGGGFRTRSRTILHPPTPDGRRCPRKLSKRKLCALPPC